MPKKHGVLLAYHDEVTSSAGRLRFKGRVWALVDVDQLQDMTERVNITLPRGELRKLDSRPKPPGRRDPAISRTWH